MSAALSAALDALFLARVPDAWAAASRCRMPDDGRVVRQHPAARRAAHRVARAWPAGRLLAHGLLQPAGLPHEDDERGVPCRQSRDGWALDDVVNATDVLRIEREEARKAPDEGVYIHGSTCTAGPKRRVPRRLGAEGALHPLRWARDGLSPPTWTRRRRRVQLPVLQVAEARRPSLRLRRRPPHRRPAGAEVDHRGL